MTTINSRCPILFCLLAFASVTAFAQASPKDMYVGNWKGEMNIGRAVPVEFAFERAGDKLNGFALDPAGQRTALADVMALDSGIVFRLDRGEGSFMVFVGKLNADKTSLTGSVDVMEGKTKPGTAPWSVKRVFSQWVTPSPAAIESARPAVAQAAYDRGVPLIKSRAFRGAQAAFNDCLAGSPKDLPCLYFRALTYNALGDAQKAIADLDMVIKLAPKPNPAIHIARAEARVGTQDFDGAIADADTAFKLNATADAYLLRGMALEAKALRMRSNSLIDGTDEKDRPQAVAAIAKALAEYNKFIELKPQDPRGYLERGIHYFNLLNAFSGSSDGDNMSSSFADLNKTIELSPQNARAFYARYLLFQAAGNPTAAAADLARYNELFKR